MEVHGRACNSSAALSNEEDMDLRRGPWTADEDHILMGYIANYGEGRWNSLSRCAGLKRTGKSCRLRWLNYLRPDVRRGNITPEEQLLILELHSRWGNRWSKIAQHLPGRTDNEIKNYWRTRVQKHAKQLHCDVNSKQFQDVMRYLWMPRLLERIHAASGGGGAAAPSTHVVATDTTTTNHQQHAPQHQQHKCDQQSVSGSTFGDRVAGVKPSPESCSMGGESSLSSSESAVTQVSSSPIADCYVVPESGGGVAAEPYIGWCPEVLPSPSGYAYAGTMDFGQSAWGEVSYENIWGLEDIWSLQQ